MFFSRKLEASPGKGQRGWFVREKEMYPLVSCLLKFNSLIGGHTIIVFTDRKSLESWYKEDLCLITAATHSAHDT